MDTQTLAGVVDEALKRSGVVWVRAAGSGHPARPLWHVWSDGTVYLLTGGIEQPAPEGLAAGGQAELVVRSKDKGSRLVSVVADVSVVEPSSPAWEPVVSALQAKRLNSPDGDRAPKRWAASGVVFALRPTDRFPETPDQPATGSLATPPPPTPATTPVPRPWHLFGRTRRAAR